jgi:glycosyltransferase involved in cell wall biosynthesis
VSLVIPAKNEATNISWVLQQIPDRVDEVVLVDGNSSDATVVTARACRPDLKVVYQDGVGKGNALRAGILTASGELIIMMDADGSMTPDEIPRIVYFLENGYDFVKGSRFMGGGGSLDITRFRRIGNRALMTMVNAIYKGGLTDLCYGFCGFHRRYIEFLDLTAPGFEVETQMTISAVRAGLRIAEVPSLELPRRHGRSNLRAISDGTRCLRTILRGHTDGVSGAAVQGVRRWLHGRAAPGPELPTQRTSGRTDPTARPASS